MRQNMRLIYNRKEDILTLELSEGPIDHAEEVGLIMTHFSPYDRLVLPEILEASDFLSKLTKATMELLFHQKGRMDVTIALPVGASGLGPHRCNGGGSVLHSDLVETGADDLERDVNPHGIVTPSRSQAWVVLS
jgi:hypothetical protein